ncbi:hypothetical protein NDU88_001415 [Pleurodeles waltl]|uniref:Uncharacterized protein n=1 Tax=Pleurodeles waltl TaxID=8319 RepID=A0AAV7R752_PLEWA|nr:hypothetical protein NDU88_001415 [Pleurodeles waltl]
MSPRYRRPAPAVLRGEAASISQSLCLDTLCNSGGASLRYTGINQQAEGDRSTSVSPRGADVAVTGMRDRAAISLGKNTGTCNKEARKRREHKKYKASSIAHKGNKQGKGIFSNPQVASHYRFIPRPHPSPRKRLPYYYQRYI